MKLDIFPHIFPTAFYERMMKLSERAGYMQKRVREIPVLADLELRFRMMDRFSGYQQVLTLASPPLEVFGDPQTSPELARIANDGMAELVAKHPDRFPAFVASVADEQHGGLRRGSGPRRARPQGPGRPDIQQRQRSASG